MNVILLVALFVGLLANIEAEQGKESVQIINHPHKNEYTSVLAGSDKHKYGYELKENRHFHHTTTEEDGVRLGCYGYVLFGKKYSTQYVADVKGYRPVFTHDLITVYPKSGGERKASFVSDFNEDEQRSENIRYFFPDGCKGIDVNPSPVVLPMPTGLAKVFTQTEGGVTPPKKIVVQPPPITFEPPKPPVESQSIKVVPATPSAPPTKPATRPTQPTARPTQAATRPTQPATKPTQAATRPTQPPTPPPTLPSTPRPTPALLTRIPAPPRSVDPGPKDTCSKSCCSDDDSAKLILPIEMKSFGKSSDSCPTYAKLVIPVEGLNPDSLKLLTRGGSDATTELIKTLLESLS